MVDDGSHDHMVDDGCHHHIAELNVETISPALDTSTSGSEFFCMICLSRMKNFFYCTSKL